MADIKWQGGSLSLAAIQNTPFKEWYSTITSTLTDKVKYELSGEEIELTLTKIFNDVNGIKETGEKPKKPSKSTSEDNKESGK